MSEKAPKLSEELAPTLQDFDEVAAQLRKSQSQSRIAEGRMPDDPYSPTRYHKDETSRELTGNEVLNSSDDRLWTSIKHEKIEKGRAVDGRGERISVSIGDESNGREARAVANQGNIGKWWEDSESPLTVGSTLEGRNGKHYESDNPLVFRMLADIALKQARAEVVKLDTKAEAAKEKDRLALAA